MKGEYGNIWVDVVSANRITSCPNPPFPFPAATQATFMPSQSFT